MTTDTELKLKLAKKLPGLIKIKQTNREDFFFWLDTGKEITEREWDWVVRKIVNEIPLSKRQDYSSHLGMIVNRKHRMATTHWLQLTAIWQEQAAALEKIGAI